MADGPIDLARCRILISNDDGIGSHGIKALEKIARDLSDDVWVVAPEQEQSGASHSLTTRHQVSITPIYLNLTNVPVLAALRKMFE